MTFFKRKPKFSVNYGLFTFYYDTAKELGRLVGESGCNMPNPYDPDNTDFDDFSEARREAILKLNK